MTNQGGFARNHAGAMAPAPPASRRRFPVAGSGKSLPRGPQHVKEQALTSALYHTFVVLQLFFEFFSALPSATFSVDCGVTVHSASHALIPPGGCETKFFKWGATASLRAKAELAFRAP
jgi:hypothetical protein